MPCHETFPSPERRVAIIVPFAQIIGAAGKLSFPPQCLPGPPIRGHQHQFVQHEQTHQQTQTVRNFDVHRQSWSQVRGLWWSPRHIVLQRKVSPSAFPLLKTIDRFNFTQPVGTSGWVNGMDVVRDLNFARGVLDTFVGKPHVHTKIFDFMIVVFGQKTTYETGSHDGGTHFHKLHVAKATVTTGLQGFVIRGGSPGGPQNVDLVVSDFSKQFTNVRRVGHRIVVPYCNVTTTTAGTVHDVPPFEIRKFHSLVLPMLQQGMFHVKIVLAIIHHKYFVRIFRVRGGRKSGAGGFWFRQPRLNIVVIARGSEEAKFMVLVVGFSWGGGSFHRWHGVGGEGGLQYFQQKN